MTKITCGKEVSNPQIGKQKCGLSKGHEYVCQYVPEVVELAPRPWSIHTNSIEALFFGEVLDANDQVLHQILRHDNDVRFWKFIVKAVNSYERFETFVDRLEDDLIEQRATQAKSSPSNGGFDHGIVTGADMILSQVINRIQAHFRTIEHEKIMTSIARDCGRAE